MKKTRESPYPLSALQQGMVYHSLLAPHSGVYVQQLVGRLRERLNVSAFKDAWGRMVARHASLRTRLRLEGAAGFLQEVEPEVVPDWTESDWSGLSAHERETEWNRQLREDRRRGFDFSRSPLMRLALFRLADDNHLFLWTYHHTLLDGRSQFIVLKELFDVYEALCRGKERPADPAPPYHEFLGWIARRDTSAAKAFWQETLNGFVPPTPLAVGSASDQPAPPDDDRGSQETYLSLQATRSLRAFAEEHDLTIGTLVQGAWAALLSRYTGEEDVVFGATRACRHAPVKGVESMVGLLINTIPLRVKLPPDVPALSWLRRIRSAWLAMRPYEHAPLPDIQDWTKFGPRNPLFESILVFEDYCLNEALRALGGNWKRREFQLLEKGSHPLVALGYGGSRLLLRLAYDRSRFDDAAAERMLGHWRTLLLALTEKPNQPLADVPILTRAERRMLLTEWNRTEKEYPRHLCLHHLVETQAAKTPDKIAVLSENERITYNELNTRANRLARHLQTVGVRPEVLVAVCLERTPELVIAVLAVLKAGGAYVPMDPAEPRERLSSMLADSGASVLLTQRGLLDRFPRHDLRIVCLESDAEAIGRQNGANLTDGASPENLAYAIYTSGSTGRPKLIAVEHGSAVNVVFFTAHHVLSARDLAVVPFADSICFDVSVHRIFAPLSVGGSIVLLESIFALPHCRHADSITLLGGAPSVLKALLQDFALPESVRVITTGAEVLNDDLLERWGQYAQVQEVVNFYGPAETTVYCSYAVLFRRPKLPSDKKHSSRPLRAAKGNIIGKPVWNVRMYVLDSRLRPVPVGVTGEIHVGGDCLARGYVNQPRLTAERFIPDPFSRDEGARLYKTGDLGRYLPDGNIEFLGRLDNQVKIRGVRIEPHGIEAVLNQSPAVRESVVRAAEDSEGEKRLVAYVVPASNGETHVPVSHAAVIDHLRGYLEQRLPRHMIPSAFVLLPVFPMTPNGKIDRSALPPPDRERRVRAEALRGPRDDMERRLVGIWEDLLGVWPVGIHDDFFDLGGNSLLATRVVSRLKDALRIDLPLRAMFEAPTVAGLAERVRDASAGRPHRKAAPITRFPRDKHVPLSYSQEMLWWVHKARPGLTAYNIPFRLRLSGPLDIPALERSLNEIVRRHEILRTTFRTVGRRPVQVIAPDLRLDVPLFDLTDLPETDRETAARKRITAESRQRMRLGGGPLVRACLLRLAHDDHILFLLIHHIIFDGWSLDVFFSELSLLYEAFSAGKPSPLPELPVQFADFALWQRQYLDGETLNELLSYWRTRLRGMPPALDLPADRPRPLLMSHKGGRLHAHLPVDFRSRLESFSRSHDATLFMTLLAAFQTLLFRRTGRSDQIVGSPIAGRNRLELEGMIGFLMNTLVLRNDLSGDPTFGDLLCRIRETTLAAYAHQDLPIQRLYEELKPRFTLRHMPFVQALFIFQNMPGRRLRLPGLKVEPLDVDNGTAKLELSLIVFLEPQGLKLIWEYSDGVFKPDSVARLADQYIRLLEAIVADADRRLSALPLSADPHVKLERSPSSEMPSPGAH
ncbi:MAG: amino acid adenylation domain-containing protein [Planctomycetota bacterium]